MIVVFSILVLVVTGLLSYRLWLYPASSLSPSFTYNPSLVGQIDYQVQRSEGKDYVLIFKDSFVESHCRQIVDHSLQSPSGCISHTENIGGTTTMTIVHTYTPLDANDYFNSQYTPSEQNLTYDALKYYATASKAANDSPDRAETLFRNYQEAVLLNNIKYSIVTDTLVTKDPLFKVTDIGSDQNVINWNGSLAIPIPSNKVYTSPSSGSLAERVLQAALDEANRAKNKQASIVGSYPVTTVKDFAPDIDKITTALKRYKSQIPTSTTNNGLSISVVDYLKYGESTEVSYSVDLAKLPTQEAGMGSLSYLQANINNFEICRFKWNDSATGKSTCVWDGKSSGKLVWNNLTGMDLSSAADTFPATSTNSPGIKILGLIAYNANNQVISKVSTTTEVGKNFVDETATGGGNFGISIITPAVVSSKNSAVVSAVPVKISVASLNAANQPPAARVSWYLCTSKQDNVVASDDSKMCSEKGTFDVSTAKTLNETTKWDASGSAVGDYSIMVKVFGPQKADKTFPYIDGSKTVGHTIELTNSKDPNAPDSSFGDGVSGDITQGWAANLKKSSIDSIEGLLKVVGPFTLLLLGILAVLAIIIAGMKYITAGGDPKGAETGKKAVLFTVFGIALTVMSVNLITITVNEVKKIIGEALPGPNGTGSLLPAGLGGPNASVLDIIGSDKGFIWEIIKLAVYYAELVAFFYILYASFLYITSFGDDSKAESGKKTLIWSIIGLAVVISANILLSIFAKVVAQ